MLQTGVNWWHIGSMLMSWADFKTRYGGEVQCFCRTTPGQFHMEGHFKRE